MVSDSQSFTLRRKRPVAASGIPKTTEIHIAKRLHMRAG